MSRDKSYISTPRDVADRMKKLANLRFDKELNNFLGFNEGKIKNIIFTEKWDESEINLICEAKGWNPNYIKTGEGSVSESPENYNEKSNREAVTMQDLRDVVVVLKEGMEIQKKRIAELEAKLSAYESNPNGKRPKKERD